MSWSKNILAKAWLALCRPRCGFIAFDFSNEVLRNLNRSELQTITSYFNNLQPLDSDELAVLSDFEEIGDLNLFGAFCGLCLRNRKAFMPIPVLPVIWDRTNYFELSNQLWVKGYKILDYRMTDTYRLILTGLQNLLKYFATADQWRLATITLRPVPHYSYQPNEPLNIATKRMTDAGITIIVAAGNERKLIPKNSLNPWSVAPWVIGVGATNEAGTRPLDTSSCGEKDQSFGRPTIVAPGTTNFISSNSQHGLLVAHHSANQSTSGFMSFAILDNKGYLFRNANGRLLITEVSPDGKISPEIPIEDSSAESRIAN